MYITILIVLFLVLILFKANQDNIKSNTKSYKVNLFLAVVVPVLTLPGLFMIDSVNKEIRYIVIGMILVTSILNLITGISLFKKIHQTKK